MSLRMQRLFLPPLRRNFTEAGIEGRGAWSTARAHPVTQLPGKELSYVIIEQRHQPVRALSLVLLMIVLAALAFVVAAQG